MESLNKNIIQACAYFWYKYMNSFLKYTSNTDL